MPDGTFLLAVSAIEEHEMFPTLAKDTRHPGLDQISQKWEKVGVSFGGTTNPFGPTDIQCGLRLPPHIKGTPDCDCPMTRIPTGTSTEAIGHVTLGEDTKCNPPPPFSRPACPSGAGQFRVGGAGI